MAINGLVHGLLLDGSGGATVIDSYQAINQWRPEDGKLWLHFDYTDDMSRQWITEQADLSEHAIDALLAGETRPRVTGTNHGHASLIFLRGVNLNPENTPEDMVSIRLYVDSNRIISTRKRHLLSIDQIRHQLTQGSGPSCITEVISTLSELIAIQMQHTLDNLELRIEKIEDDLYQNETLTIGQEISAIRRQSITLKRYIAPQQTALNKLYESSYPWIDEEFRHEFKESANHLMRYVEELEMVVERAQIAYEERSDLQSAQLNKRMYVMALVAAIFLPLGFLTGLLGINVGGIPGAENPAAFYIFIGLLVSLTGSLLSFFWWRNWL